MVGCLITLAVYPLIMHFIKCYFQLMFLADGLNIHNDKCPEALIPFHENMVNQFDKLLKTCDEEYGIVVCIIIYLLYIIL